MGCKKDTITDNPDNPNNPSPPPITNTDSTLNQNVHVIDSTKLILNSDSSEINQGVFKYTFLGVAPEFKINDVIVGATDGGYIRRISKINKEQGKISLQTSQGTMEDVFQKANFSFSTSMDALTPEGRGVSEHTFDISGINILQDGPLSIKLNKGTINVGGDWNFDLDFDNSRLQTFKMEGKNTSFNGQFDFAITVDKAFSIEKNVVLKRVAKNFIKWVVIGQVPIPVVVKMEMELRGRILASIQSKVNNNFSVNTNNIMSIGLNYANSQWETTYGKTSALTISDVKFNDKLNGKLEVDIIPYVSFRFYRLIGPYASIGLRELVKAGHADPAGDWDYYAGAWIQTIVGARAAIFSKSILDKNAEWNTDPFYYQTPDRLKKISGDNQTSSVGQYLKEPVKVRVVDNVGSPQGKIGVPVYFTVVDGGGSVDQEKVLTDENGDAQTKWKLGNSKSTQTLKVEAKSADGTLIKDAPLEFAAITENQNTISIASGDNQSAPPGKILPNPLVVKVVDANNKPAQGIKVEWITTDGSISASSNETDSNGVAQASWTLGSAEGEQKLTVKATDANAKEIKGSPVTFTAVATTVTSSSWKGWYKADGWASQNPPVCFTDQYPEWDVPACTAPMTFDMVDHGDGTVSGSWTMWNAGTTFTGTIKGNTIEIPSMVCHEKAVITISGTGVGATMKGQNEASYFEDGTMSCDAITFECTRIR